MLFGEFNILGENIDAILVTHEHIDHTKSLSTLSNKYNIPIYATRKTWNSLDNISQKIDQANIKFFNILEFFNIGDLKIFPFPVPHDAIDPVGFNIYHLNTKISIATDLGQISEDTLNYLKNSSCVLLESNYDPEILKCSSYPYHLKQRISGNIGHLSNISAGKTLSTLYDSGLQKALLVHLSNENNFPELAYETVANVLTHCQNLDVSIAPRNNPSQMFEVS